MVELLVKFWYLCVLVIVIVSIGGILRMEVSRAHARRRRLILRRLKEVTSG